MREIKKDSDKRVLKPGERQRLDRNMYEYRWTDKFGKRRSITAKTLNELREKEKQAIKDEVMGVKHDKDRMTLNDVYHLWKKTKRGLKANTFQNYQYMYTQYVYDEFGNIRIIDLKRSDVKLFYNRLYDGGLKPATIETIHNVIHQLLELAVDDDIIRFNPSDKALKELLMEHNKDSVKRVSLIAEEENLLISFLLNSEEYRRWYPIIMTMMIGGLRVGEATALQWKDINFEQNYIDVNKTLVYFNSYSKGGCVYAVNTTKTTAGERKVPMLGSVREAILMEKKMHEEKGLTCQSSIDGYDDFVFLNRFGLALNFSTVNKALERIVKVCNEQQLMKYGDKKALLLPRISNHILRHTCATRLNDSQINTKAIQTILGHADIQTTMDIYVDASKELMSGAAEEYEKYLKKNVPLAFKKTKKELYS